MKDISSKDNALGESIKTLKNVWRHRESFSLFGREINQIKLLKWRIDFDNKLPAAVLDTIDSLYPEGKPRPLLTHQKRKSNGWHMVFTPAPGVAPSELINKQEYFAAACRCPVTLEYKQGYIHIDINDYQLKNFYDYHWDPKPYLEKGLDLPVPIGYSHTGELVVADISSLPHIRCGGTTYTGKSSWLHSLFISLANLGPKKVLLAVIDMALLEFSYVRKYAAFASDTITALKMLQALEREMHRRRRVLCDAGVVKIQDYTGDDLPFIVVIIDEFSFLCPDGTFDKEEKELRRQCQTICSNLAALARKCGIHLCVAMQRPDASILPGQLKSNLPGAISFRCINRVNSQIILDSDAAAEIPNVPGRAIWQVGNIQQEVQTMYLSPAKAKKILKDISPGVNVDAIHQWFNHKAKSLPAR